MHTTAPTYRSLTRSGQLWLHCQAMPPLLHLSDSATVFRTVRLCGTVGCDRPRRGNIVVHRDGKMLGHRAV